jgi:hypothetical protein
MFQINPNPTFTTTVDIPVAGGRTEKLKLTFKHKTRDDALEYLRRPAGEGEDDASILLEIIAGWEDVDAEFSRETLNQVVQNYPGAPRAIFDAYAAELMGQRRGN